jgi:hypothetical protein
MKKTTHLDTSTTSSNGSSGGKGTKVSTESSTKTTNDSSTLSFSKSKRKQTPWGTYGTLSERLKFRGYLKKITTVESFTQTSGAGLAFLRKLPRARDVAIRRHLRNIDNAGYEKLMSLSRGLTQKRRRKKEDERKSLMPVITNKDIKQCVVGVEQSIAEVPAASTVRFVSEDGIKHVAAICLAAGYKREETALILGMALGELNLLVSDMDIKAAVKDVNKAVVAAADQKVLRDLLKGEVTDETNRADLIASRRKKLVLDASAEARNIVKDTEELQKKREQYLNKRFGVITTEVVSEDSDG